MTVPAARTRTVGVIAPQLSSLYYGELLSGMHAVLHPQGIQLLAIQATPAELAEFELAARVVDGWIAVNNAGQAERLAQGGAPIVTIGAVATGGAFPAVLPNNHGGMRAATAHLIEHGHRAIAFVGNLSHFDNRQRYEGYLSALAGAGIAADPALRLDIGGTTMSDGREAVRRLARQGASCTAVAAATDELAIGMLMELDERRDNTFASLAVVGFDNIIPAQTSRPPLTTVHAAPAAIGAAAAELMLRGLTGDTTFPLTTYVPTSLVVRSSCGCAHLASADAVAELAAPVTSDAVLVDRIAQLVKTAPGQPADQREPPWPDGELLARGLSAAVEGTPAPPLAELVQACQATIALNSDVDRVMALVFELERAGAQRLAGAGDPAARQRVDQFLATVRAELVRAMVEQTRNLYLSTFDQVRQNQQASLLLFAGDDEDVRRLAWLAALPFSAGCLGLWERGAPSGHLAIVGTYGGGMALAAGRAHAATFPFDTMPAHAASLKDELTVVLPIGSAAHRWGVLALRVSLAYLRSSVNYDTLGVLAAQIDMALARQQLRERFASEQARTLALSAQVRELSCPVIPLLRDVLLVPLIGSLDASRIPQIMEAVLQGVAEQQASYVLIDITGVPLVDTQAANALLQTAQAATLLGARVMLVGIRPEIAQSIIGLGIDLRLIATEATLSAAVQRLMRDRERR